MCRFAWWLSIRIMWSQPDRFGMESKICGITGFIGGCPWKGLNWPTFTEWPGLMQLLNFKESCRIMSCNSFLRKVSYPPPHVFHRFISLMRYFYANYFFLNLNLSWWIFHRFFIISIFPQDSNKIEDSGKVPFIGYLNELRPGNLLKP